MRSVDIRFDSRRVLPGETLTGDVIVKTDKEFVCNRVVLKILSKERTEVGSGDNRHTDEKYIISRVFRISEGRTIPEGTTLFPFAFNLPRNLPPTYNGNYGYIRHTVEGVVEVDWVVDPKMTEEYQVIQHRPPYIPEIVDTAAISKSNKGLHIQLDEDCVRMDKGILVRFKVDDKSRMRGVRLEIRKREDAKCGWSDVDNSVTVGRKFHELNLDDWGRWIEIRIGENWRNHLPFRSQLFRISYHLKVTLEIDLGLDPSIKIPLLISDSAPEAPEENVLDEIALDLGMDDW